MSTDTALRVLVIAVVAYGVLVLLARALAGPMMFHPPEPSYGAELVTARVPVGESDTLAVLRLPRDDARYTVLFSHGNAEDLGHARPLLAMIREAGYDVVAYDYRGYGRSTGRPTPAGAVADLAAVHDWVVDELGVPPDRIVLHGRSLGSGPMLALAGELDVAGVVLESAFAGAYRVVTHLPVLPFDPFPNLRRIRELDAPVLVMHGEEDGVIPVWHGRELYEAAPGPKRALWVDGAGHNDLVPVAGARYVEALRGFADLLDSRR